MQSLTERQQEIINFIEDFQERSGMAPTVQEIADHFGLKSSTVFAHLRALQRKNQLARSSKARSIVVSRSRLPGRMPPGVWTLPLLGRVSAGLPKDSVEYKEGEVEIAAGFVKAASPDRLFALRIMGESMRDLGILDGDIVIVDADAVTPRPGDVVVAAVEDGETTVKSFYPAPGGKIELRPANPAFQSRFYAGDRLRVQGRVIGLQRTY
jgi:repressor LexA